MLTLELARVTSDLAAGHEPIPGLQVEHIDGERAEAILKLGDALGTTRQFNATPSDRSNT